MSCKKSITTCIWKMISEIKPENIKNQWHYVASNHSFMIFCLKDAHTQKSYEAWLAEVDQSHILLSVCLWDQGQLFWSELRCGPHISVKPPPWEVSCWTRILTGDWSIASLEAFLQLRSQCTYTVSNKAWVLQPFLTFRNLYGLSFLCGFLSSQHLKDLN